MKNFVIRLGADITPISEVYAKCGEYYLDRHQALKKLLSKLPKGSLVRRNIKGYLYYYLVYRDRGKFISKYIGKTKPMSLHLKILRRRKYKKQMRMVKAALFALGLERRRPTGPSAATRFDVLKRDGFTCQYCGRTPKMHGVVLVVDHKHAKKRGGDNSLDNLVTACVECNSGKRARLLTEKPKSNKT